MKYLLFLFYLSSSLFAGNNASVFSLTGAISEQTSQKQRDITTKADFVEFISTLESVLKMGQINPYSFFLASAYLTDFNLTDGVIKKDIEKAKFYFHMSLDDGNHAAAYQLAMIDVHSKQYGKALFILDKTITAIKRDRQGDPYKKGLAQSFLAATFGSITMQFLYNDKEAVHKAIILLENTTFRDDTPTAVFLLANLYQVSGKVEKANKLLSDACNYRGKNKDRRLDEICKQYAVKAGKR